MRDHEKLIRDRVPAVIRACGELTIVRVATPDEYRGFLRAQLIEEVTEFLGTSSAAGGLTELVDVIEVARALAGDLGFSPEDLEAIRRDKEAERGGFTRRFVGAGNQSPTRHHHDAR